jgi:hypothetical protein
MGTNVLLLRVKPILYNNHLRLWLKALRARAGLPYETAAFG